MWLRNCMLFQRGMCKKEPTPHSSPPAADVSKELRRSLHWGRLAEPQADLYDSHAVLTLVTITTSSERPVCYVRTAPFATLQVAPVLVAEELPPGNQKWYSDADADHPCIQEAIELLQCSPAGANQ